MSFFLIVLFKSMMFLLKQNYVFLHNIQIDHLNELVWSGFSDKASVLNEINSNLLLKLSNFENSEGYFEKKFQVATKFKLNATSSPAVIKYIRYRLFESQISSSYCGTFFEFKNFFLAQYTTPKPREKSQKNRQKNIHKHH